jgi:hypothetical protein
MQLLAKRHIGEHRLYQVLAVVERSLDRYIGDVRRGNRGHLTALHRADAIVRVQERDVDSVATDACLDRGGTGVARSGADDRHACVALRQDMIEQPAEKLQRHVLERERRAVEQFLHEQTGVKLDQRHDGGMAEAGVGVAAQRGERGEGDGLADERLDHPRGKRMVWQAAHRPPVGRREVWPALRHVEPTVLGEAGQKHAGEVADGRLAAGGDVAHARHTSPRSRRAECRQIVRLS